MSHPYDRVAPNYDAAFSTAEARAEDLEVINSIDYRGETVLDIGCGTGLFLDYITPSWYVGIDPSKGMLNRLRDKHAAAFTLAKAFEDFDNGIVRFDLAVSLFGSLNYVKPEHIARIPEMLKPTGRYFLMLAKEAYTPVTHTMFSMEVPFYHHPRSILPGRIREIGNYFVIDGTRDEALSQTERLRRRA